MKQQRRTLTAGVILQVLLFVVVVPCLPLLISRQWDWWQAWVYAMVSILGFVISRALAARRNPGLLAERARMLRHEDAKSWDKTLAPPWRTRPCRLSSTATAVMPSACAIACCLVCGRRSEGTVAMTEANQPLLPERLPYPSQAALCAVTVADFVLAAAQQTGTFHVFAPCMTHRQTRFCQAQHMWPSLWAVHGAPATYVRDG